MNNQFSPKVTEILNFSKEEAIRLQSDMVNPEHILLGVLRSGEGKAFEILKSLTPDVDKIRRDLEIACLQPGNSGNNREEDVVLSPKTTQIMKICLLEARLVKSDVADTEHILLAIMKDSKNLASTILTNMNISYDDIKRLAVNQTEDKTHLPYEDEDEEDFPPIEPSNGKQSSAGGFSSMNATQTSSQTNSSTMMLDNFSIDLTQAASKGLLDPVVGREQEIERVIQILSRRKKNNPILLGEPGVGKSAIVEGLALRIAEKKVSRALYNKRVVSLDLSSLVAGTKYRGQLEERLRKIITEVQNNKNVILFIDEIHSIIGAGSTPGSLDTANILKPSLARGDLQCIGATTFSEFKKTIEKDGALERRFQKVTINPSSKEETLTILHNIKDKYEAHHHVHYTDEALQACVNYTDRYITNRFFPDKAFDALDEAGARARILNVKVPKEIEEKEQEIKNLQHLKNEAVKSQNFELAADYRDQENTAQNEYQALKAAWEKEQDKERTVIDEPQIAAVVSSICGIPVEKISESEGARLKSMKQTLQNAVIGQDEAIDKLVKAIQRNRVGLKDPNKPIGVFMLLGPTGVGKTYLSKKLAEVMFGSSDAMIRIDMSEYMAKESVSRMIGAPPGYVGYDEGGQLTEMVKRKPYSIILFDEIEKAHPDVQNVLLQLFDEGRLTDGNGTTTDFRNTIIIMTSNCGTRQVGESGKKIGFNNQEPNSEAEKNKAIISKAINKQFSPEFLNRLDEIINFEPLNKEHIKKIVDIEIKPLQERILEIGYQFEADDSACEFLAEKGYHSLMGARPLKRSIQQYIEDEICDLVLNQEIKPGDSIHASWNKGDEKLTFEINKQTEK